jgi:hypothetical protein
METGQRGLSVKVEEEQQQGFKHFFQNIKYWKGIRNKI